MNNTAKEKQNEWETHFSNCKTSGLSQTKYCKEQGINEAKFYYWKKRLGLVQKKPKPETTRQPFGFVPVQVSQPHQGFTIRLRNGIVIEGLPLHDEATLAMIEKLNSL